MTRAEFDDHLMLYRGRCAEHFAKAVGDAIGVHYVTADTTDKVDLLFAGNAVLQSLTESGWELVFSDEGEFKYVIT